MEAKTDRINLFLKNNYCDNKNPIIKLNTYSLFHQAFSRPAYKEISFISYFKGETKLHYSESFMVNNKTFIPWSSIFFKLKQSQK